eukprot:4603399-Lingulodinium_polyedra.AAC.1
MAEVVGRFATADPHKSHGEDLVHPRLLHHAPRAFAAIFHPIMVKAEIRLRHPLLWQGACVAHFPKPLK